jgi:hypothetical protein
MRYDTCLDENSLTCLYVYAELLSPACMSMQSSSSSTRVISTEVQLCASNHAGVSVEEQL